MLPMRTSPPGTGQSPTPLDRERHLPTATSRKTPAPRSPPAPAAVTGSPAICRAPSRAAANRSSATESTSRDLSLARCCPPRTASRRTAPASFAAARKSERSNSRSAPRRRGSAPVANRTSPARPGTSTRTTRRRNPSESKNAATAAGLSELHAKRWGRRTRSTPRSFFKIPAFIFLPHIFLPAPNEAGEKCGAKNENRIGQRISVFERSRTKCPLRPPDFSNNSIGPIDIPRSTALHMS